jgi:zinc protease
LKKSDAPVIAVQLWYKTGSVREQEGIRGVSHILEHMMFRGSKNVATEEHARRINDIGGHCNAFTAEDVTAYINSVPKEHLDMVLSLEADRMCNLHLDEALLETERKVIVEEYHTYLNNPVAKAFLEFRAMFYDHHPYKLGPLGKIEDIQGITVSDVRNYYLQWYRPENAVCVIVGDFESFTALVDTVEKHFGTINDTTTLQESATIPPVPSRQGIWMRRKVDFDVPIIVTGYPAPASAEDDSLTLDILQMIISQGETGRLNREIVRKQSLAVMAGGMNHFLKHTGMSLFFAAFTPDVPCNKVDRAIDRQIQLIKENGITDLDIQKVKNVTVTGRTFELFSAEHLCQRIGFSETIDGDYSVWVKKLEALEKINRERLHEIARKYWAPETKYTLFLQPKKINPLLFSFGFIRRLLPKRH